MALACVAPFNSLARQEDEDEDDLSPGLFKGATDQALNTATGCPKFSQTTGKIRPGDKSE